MRQTTFVLSNLALSGILLLQTAGRLHGESTVYTGKNSPDTFNALDAQTQAKLKHSNDLYGAGKISLSADEADLINLEKSVTTVSGPDSIAAPGDGSPDTAPAQFLTSISAPNSSTLAGAATIAGTQDKQASSSSQVQESSSTRRLAIDSDHQ